MMEECISACYHELLRNLESLGSERFGSKPLREELLDLQIGSRDALPYHPYGEERCEMVACCLERCVGILDNYRRMYLDEPDFLPDPPAKYMTLSWVVWFWVSFLFMGGGMIYLKTRDVSVLAIGAGGFFGNVFDGLKKVFWKTEISGKTA